MELAARKLETAVKLIANFRTEEIPPLRGEALEIFTEPINRIDQANRFLKSFCSVAFLQQMVPLADPQKAKD